MAEGDAEKGRREWEYTCKHCHGTPQPRKPGAFSDYNISANKLSVYASDPSAITKAANEGYKIPEGNENDEYLPGTSTSIPMGTFVGDAFNRLGIGTTPTQYAINFSAYFASLFDVPGAPTIGAVTAGNEQATVSFTAPKSELTITSYTVTANPDGITATGTASPIVVAGLSNGKSYTFTVVATSNAGNSKPSSASNSVALAAPTKAAPVSTPVIAAAPVIVRNAPVPLFAATGNVPNSNAPQAKAAPVAPSNNVVQSKAAPLPSPVAPVAKVAPISVTQTIAPKAPPALGTQSVASNPAATTAVTSVVAASGNGMPAKAALPPSSVAQALALRAPRIKFVRAGNAEAKIFFDIPAGSTNISGYTVNAFSNGTPTGIKVSGAKSPLTVSGLTNGTDYTFTLTANSSAGSSAASAQSDPVTPLSILGD